MKRHADGFTLIEVMLALFLIGLGLLAAAPLFIYAAQGTAVGADFGSAGAIAVERLELLRGVDFDDLALAQGGSLTADVTGYFDASHSDFDVRWLIVDNVSPPNTKTITVTVTAKRQVVGLAKGATVTTLRAK
jgi:prepilin-type N-terminal cleavage/methylation domain-containing protein